MAIPKLNDLQLVLLSTASQRANGSFYPLPVSATDRDRARKGLQGLLKRGFAAEAENPSADQTWREDDGNRIGLVITKAGQEALGLENPEAEREAGESPMSAASDPAPRELDASKPAPRGTKQALLIELLQADGGASIDEIVRATGWLPHTTRAAMTGLKKRGFEIAREKQDGTSRYSIRGRAE